MTGELTAHVLTRGRQTRFTPERIQQIRNLVERGKSREEIAELIGVTLVPCKSPAQGWGSACGDPFLTLEPVFCGEVRPALMEPAIITLMMAVTAWYCT